MVAESMMNFNSAGMDSPLPVGINSAASVTHAAALANESTAAKSLTTSMSFDHGEFLRILTADSFPEDDAKQWVDDHFMLTFQVSTLYVIWIFGTRYLLRNRAPFSLFIPLNAWNLFLAVFSIMGTIRLTPEFFDTLFNKGFQASYCKTEGFTAGLNGYWVWLFIVSKMFELVDTVFLVLRKRPLLFLHWYHHILTMIYAFYSYPNSPGFNRWGIYLNFTVHAFMYSYYFLRSMKIRVPGSVAKFITTIQILQFVISVAILVHLGYLIFAKQVQCDLDHKVFWLAVAMDISYLVLFVNFFLQAYVLKGGKAKYKSPKGVTSAGTTLTSNGTAAKLLKEEHSTTANGKLSNGNTANGHAHHEKNGSVHASD